jgi:hypothetical protein
MNALKKRKFGSKVDPTQAKDLALTSGNTFADLESMYIIDTSYDGEEYLAGTGI